MYKIYLSVKFHSQNCIMLKDQMSLRFLRTTEMMIFGKPTSGPGTKHGIILSESSDIERPIEAPDGGLRGPTDVLDVPLREFPRAEPG